MTSEEPRRGPRRPGAAAFASAAPPTDITADRAAQAAAAVPADPPPAEVAPVHIPTAEVAVSVRAPAPPAAVSVLDMTGWSATRTADDTNMDAGELERWGRYLDDAARGANAAIRTANTKLGKWAAAVQEARTAGAPERLWRDPATALGVPIPPPQ